MSTPPQGPPAQPQFDPSEQMLKYFSWKHLPEGLQVVSQPFAKLAGDLAVELPPGPEKTTCLRKLLEAKDCAVRAAL